MGTARGWWEGTTLVVESGAFKAPTRGTSRQLRLIERFTAIVATAAATSFELLRELLTLGTDFVNELGIGRELLP
jgi:hypothetical protein